MNPRVSIGMPVYNGENFVGDALDALLRETFTDFEIVISDNASTDRTGEICRAFAARDARIRYFRNERNIGPGPNFNRVFELSRGEYFMWAAHDDSWDPTYIARCVQVLDRDPEVVLCHARTRFIDDRGRPIGEYREKLRSDSPEVHIRFRDLIMNLKCFEIFGLIRARVLRLTPLLGSFGHADGILLTRLGLYGRFCEIPEFLYLNRDHPDKSIYKYSTYRDYAQFYDPRNARKILFPRWRMGYEYLRALFEVPISAGEQLRCAAQFLRWVRAYWPSLGANVAFGLWLAIRSFFSRKARYPHEEGRESKVVTKLDLKAGDVVEVRSEEEIRKTLDADGTFEGIPFMEEMRQYCGRTFRVFKRADKICVEGAYISRLRDAVFLEEIRCDGAAHDGCDRMCLIFWKEAWLKRARAGAQPEPPVEWVRMPETDGRAPVSDKTYFCQSTALIKAVEPLSGWDFKQYIRDITSRSFSVWQVVKAIVINFYNMIMRYTGGEEFGAAVGREVKTPNITLELQQGDLVEVKSREEIIATIDPAGKNRGLRIDYEMLRHAGKQYRVLRRADRIILETTGKMREIQNTVLLDNGACEGLCRRACARNSHPMWREAWLKKVQEKPDGRTTMSPDLQKELSSLMEESK